MKIVCVGGGPAGLYFAILMKKADPSHEIEVIERNPEGVTFGFGVVFSDATLENFAAADPPTNQALRRSFAHWDDIETHYNGRRLRSSGHGFCGMGRAGLLALLTARARELGVKVTFDREVEELTAFADADLLVLADGVNSRHRERYAALFQPQIDERPNRFIWLGTSFPYDAFTFYFKANEAGLWRVHAYRYGEDQSTFILECTASTFERSGLREDDEEGAIAYAKALFEEELKGHTLIAQRSFWRRFPTIRNRRWWAQAEGLPPMVLLGDAAHTAHFSVGSGTKLAMEDAIVLEQAIRRAGGREGELTHALASYEEERRPQAESLQRAAQSSLEWFEHTERYMALDPIQFEVSLLTRSLRITHDNLKLRDPEFGDRIERWFAERAAQRSGRPAPPSPPPPMLTPFKLRELVLENRVVVSPMCMYCAEDGTVGDWHLVHIGSRAMGGAGLVICEMTDVSREARISPGCAGLYKDEHVGAWRRITDFVHAHTDSKIGVQLGHAGRKGSTQTLWEEADHPLEEGNWPLLSASPIPYLPVSQVPKAMDEEDMAKVRVEFVRAAERAEAAGFDHLEIHFAHGYLLASFLSPLTNRREDEHGGSIENRLRFPLSVYDAVRAVWPAHKPISVRLSATDWRPGGLSEADLLAAARILKARGVDLLDVSAGQTVADQRPVYGRLFQTPFSELLRLEVGIPTITVGNVTSFEDINSVLVAGRADLVALARGHLFDPYLTRHAAYRFGYPMPWPKQYLSAARYNARFTLAPEESGEK